jgi:hypothetical protein
VVGLVITMISESEQYLLDLVLASGDLEGITARQLSISRDRCLRLLLPHDVDTSHVSSHLSADGALTELIWDWGMGMTRKLTEQLAPIALPPRCT